MTRTFLAVAASAGLEVVMPCFHKFRLVLPHETLDPIQFGGPEPIVVRLPDCDNQSFAVLSARATWTCTGSFRSLAKKKNRYGPLRKTVGLTVTIVARSTAVDQHAGAQRIIPDDRQGVPRAPANGPRLSGRAYQRAAPTACWATPPFHWLGPRLVVHTD